MKGQRLRRVLNVKHPPQTVKCTQPGCGRTAVYQRTTRNRSIGLYAAYRCGKGHWSKAVQR